MSAAIVILEDSPLFNAGRGAVFTADGVNSLDASIMDGTTLRAGAVAGVTDVKNPIVLARLVMEKSPHVMLSGTGAERFAREQGIPSHAKGVVLHRAPVEGTPEGEGGRGEIALPSAEPSAPSRSIARVGWRQGRLRAA